MKILNLKTVGLLLIAAPFLTAQTPPTNPVYSYSVPAGGYAPNGNLMNYSDSVSGTWSMQYDSLNRLKNATSQSVPYNDLALEWHYDSFGNRLSQTPSGSGVANAELSMQYDSNNRITTSSIGVVSSNYDAAGNLKYDGLNSIQYDAENRVCAVQNSNGTVSQYLYNAEGQRVAKGYSASGAGLVCPTLGDFVPTEKYILGPSGEQITELHTQQDGTDVWQHTNVYANGELLATYDQEGSQHLLHFNINDPLGTKRVQTSGYGVSELRLSSLPYGDGLNSFGTAQGATEHFYTGKERDSESGLDYFGARYYGSNIGRFMSPDYSYDYDPEPVPHADLENPQTLNLYGYVQNNPLSTADPDGHEAGCTTTTTTDSDGTIHVTHTCSAEPSPLLLGAAFTLGNEELGPAAWIGAGILGAAACIQTHCGSAIVNLFSKPSTPAPTVAPQVSTPKTPEPPNEPDPKNLTKNVRKIAQKLGKSVRDVNDAIHDVKRGMPRGGPVKNPDVLVDTETGEVYPQTPSGHGDSIGNINDHLQ